MSEPLYQTNQQGREAITFTVQGVPQAKGSMRQLMRNGKPIIINASNATATWQRLVSKEAKLHQPALGPYAGAVRVSLDFRFARPRKTKYLEFPQGKDLDKLVRCVFDAMTGVTFRDDVQVCDVAASKRYGNPGVTVGVSPLQEFAEI